MEFDSRIFFFLGWVRRLTGAMWVLCVLVEPESMKITSQFQMMREYRYNKLKKKFNVYTASLLLFFYRVFWTQTMFSHGCLLFCLNKQLMRWCATWKITILILKKKAECEMDAMVEHITLKMFLVSLDHALRIILISMVCFGSQISFLWDPAGKICSKISFPEPSVRTGQVNLRFVRDHEIRRLIFVSFPSSWLMSYLFWEGQILSRFRECHW